MGTHIFQVDSMFTIRPENVEHVIGSIEGLAKQLIREGRDGYLTERILKAESLEDKFDAMQWYVVRAEDGGIRRIRYRGEKYGDDLMFLSAFAPFVEQGSYIEMASESGERWRWMFNGRTCREVHARIVYDDNDDQQVVEGAVHEVSPPRLEAE
jgi:hypothetical protein